MSDNNVNEELKTIAACSENLQIIKDLLSEAKTKTIYAGWAFYVWGLITIIGGMVHFIVEGLYTLSAMQYFIYIWVPILILVGLFELISFIQNLARHALPIFSGPILKFYLSLFIFCPLIIFTTIVLVEHHSYHFIPLLFTFAASGFFALYALVTHLNYFIPGGFLSAISIFLYFLSLPTRTLVLVCCICVGIAWISSGVICYYLEKKE
ncbi:MAG: hypothetical protein JXJ04_01185 [Spirochaetales bacterium]|nr:hypothetical protein [Spirochaetales bacterium]